MKKSNLLLAAIASVAIVGGVASKAWLQPLPPDRKPPQPKQGEQPSLPIEKPSIPSEQPSLPIEKPSGQPSLPNPKQGEQPNLPIEKPSEQPALPDGEALLEAISNLVIQKYEAADCEELSAMQSPSDKGSQAGGGQDAAMQEKAIALLKQNPEIREKFLNRVAPPIANKMFDCNVIP